MEDLLMSLNKKDRAILESINTMLSDKAQLGLSVHNLEDEKLVNERGYEYLHNQLDDQFAHEAADLDHYDTVCALFYKTHTYKYIDDPTFILAMDKDMRMAGVPAIERNRAKEIVEKLIDGMKKDDIWAEKDSGWNKNLDELNDITQPDTE